MFSARQRGAKAAGGLPQIAWATEGIGWSGAVPALLSLLASMLSQKPWTIADRQVSREGPGNQVSVGVGLPTMRAANFPEISPLDWTHVGVGLPTIAATQALQRPS